VSVHIFYGDNPTERRKVVKKSTPWGPAQQAKELAPGIISYSTAGHGGFWLSSYRRKRLNYAQSWLKTAEWWEEDCDWAIPYYFFRAEIGRNDPFKFIENLEAAVCTIVNYHPDFAKREGLGALA